jgi:hypothetical protein
MIKAKKNLDIGQTTMGYYRQKKNNGLLFGIKGSMPLRRVSKSITSFSAIQMFLEGSEAECRGCGVECLRNKFKGPDRALFRAPSIAGRNPTRSIAGRRARNVVQKLVTAIVAPRRGGATQEWRRRGVSSAPQLLCRAGPVILRAGVNLKIRSSIIFFSYI